MKETISYTVTFEIEPEKEKRFTELFQEFYQNVKDRLDIEIRIKNG